MPSSPTLHILLILFAYIMLPLWEVVDTTTTLTTNYLSNGSALLSMTVNLIFECPFYTPSLVPTK